LKQTLVIIPTFNEIENVEKIIPIVLALDNTIDVLIIDDGSPDGTAIAVKSLMLKYQNRLFLKERQGKLGLGTAYILGFKYGIENGYQLICEMDSDFSHPPDKLLALIAACNNGADLAVGSRYTKGGKVENWPIDRIVMSYGASVYTRLITCMPIKDPTAGFVCYKATVLSKLNLNEIKFVGYAFQIEMKYRAWKAGFKLVEVPITFKDRVFGISKMSTSIFKEGFFGVWKMRFNDNKIN
jgi:dolichol-phosphate mannosyltransferase